MSVSRLRSAFVRKQRALGMIRGSLNGASDPLHITAWSVTNDPISSSTNVLLRNVVPGRCFQSLLHVVVCSTRSEISRSED